MQIMNNRKIFLFLSFTFAITWISWWLLSGIKHDDSRIFSNPVYLLVFLLGGIAPAIASYLTIKHSDKAFKDFNRSVLKSRVDLLFYLFIIITVLGVRLLAISVYGFINTPIWDDLSPQYIALIFFDRKKLYL
jgi:hypothetical protein